MPEESEMHTAVVNRTPSGQLLGICVAIPAEIVEPFADKDSIRFEITAVEEGILLKVIGVVGGALKKKQDVGFVAHQS